VPKASRFDRTTLFASTALALIAAAMVVVFLGGLGDDGGSGGSAASTTIATLKVDPEPKVDPKTVTFTEFDGTEVPLTSIEGTPTLINFFASTCVPCVTEMPDLEKAHQALGTKVQFLGLAVQDRIAASEDLIERTGVTYRTARDPDALILQLFNGVNLPFTVLIDGQGHVVATHAGQMTTSEVESLIAEKLGIST
jgi:thiol-disulfide isomerase/thioredoxin